jgi:7,8-dihydropterin-6-yl-methyl-4-(beta-D-ribofuranosyl)aminobenzene 5'-phosphate synthase
MLSAGRILAAILLGWMMIMTSENLSAKPPDAAAQAPLRLHVVFNNLPYRPGLVTGWGFACLIQMQGENVLFDSGGDGDILLANMQQMGLDPGDVNAVVLSHIHSDHTGGLGGFLARNSNVTVYLPASFPAAFQRGLTRHGARVQTVSGPRQLFGDMYSTGEMGRTIREQALIVDTPVGMVLVTGCAHPNVADIAEQARAFLGRDIQLLMGGFHLGGSSDAEIQTIIERLKALGVRQVAPSHCTGEKAIGMFRAAWGDDFIDGGLGAVIAVPARR